VKVVFVHGAFVSDAQWWWNRMVAPLAFRGLSTTAVELPSCGGGGDVHTDADAVAAVLGDEPVVLVGHSYGGMVITDAGLRAHHLVYVTSVLPDEGESLDLVAGAGAPFIHPREDGTAEVQGDVLPELFMQDCDTEAVEGALKRLSPQSQTAFDQAPRAIAWRSVPSTYVVCAQDRATVPQRQRVFARRAQRVVEIPTGHHPFLSHPELLADVIADTVGGRGRRPPHDAPHRGDHDRQRFSAVGEIDVTDR
jgi:pimeloyl-ACP methyl ester carboxylesterase